MNNSLRFFFLGILSAGAALVMESITSTLLPLDLSASRPSTIQSIITIVSFVVIEEGLRYSILNSQKDRFNNKNSAAIYGTLIGAGFAVAETGLAFVSSVRNFSPVSMLLPSIVHLWAGWMMGMAVFLPNRFPEKRGFLVGAVVLIHVLYNLSQLNSLTISVGGWVLVITVLCFIGIAVLSALPRLVTDR